jgi:hypothetical protein
MRGKLWVLEDIAIVVDVSMHFDFREEARLESVLTCSSFFWEQAIMERSDSIFLRGES